jgi:hypothetical protein
MAFSGGATPPTIKVTLTDVDHCDGSSSSTFTFPAGRTGSVTISVPATHLRLKFSVPAGYENFPVSFQLSPNGGTWSNGNADSQFGIMFSQGTNYTLVASNVL